MPGTLTIATYKFNELSDESKDRALDSNRDFYQDSNWYQDIQDTFHKEVEALGYYNVDSRFSGFYSQGDGASFTGHLRLQDWLKARKLAGKYRALYNQAEYADIGIERTQWHNYVHYNTITCEYSDNGYLTQHASDQLTEVAGLVQEEARELSKVYYKRLEESDEYLTSDECITEGLVGGDYNFTEAGELL